MIISQNMNYIFGMFQDYEDEEDTDNEEEEEVKEATPPPTPTQPRPGFDIILIGIWKYLDLHL